MRVEGVGFKPTASHNSTRVFVMHLKPIGSYLCVATLRFWRMGLPAFACGFHSTVPSMFRSCFKGSFQSPFYWVA